MSGRRLSVSYNENSLLYRVITATGITDYPPGRTMIKEQVDRLIREGVQVTIRSAKPVAKKDPWEMLLRGRIKR